MKFENTSVFNFKSAFYGMRNPLNSWDKSDSFFSVVGDNSEEINKVVDLWVKEKYPDYSRFENTKEEQRCFNSVLDYIKSNCVLNTNQTFHDIAVIGPNDMKLATNLIRGGSEHRKFLRQIFVCTNITAPLYWWKEMDTYKVGTVSNSTSTMHTITSKPITLDCFELDDFDTMFAVPDKDNPIISPYEIIKYCEWLRQQYLETKNKKYWKELIRWLPESWLQTRTVTCNYENLLSICNQRKNHKLTEWSESFMSWVETLPYAKDLILNTNDGLNYL